FLVDISHSKLENNQMITKSYQTLSIDIQEKALYELHFNKGKRMILFESFTEDLIYAFLNDEDIIELYYDEDFVYESKSNILKFNIKNVTYEISDSGINVIMPPKTVKLNAIKNEYNRFNNSTFSKFKNVSYR